jgi:hypothetical protein
LGFQQSSIDECLFFKGSSVVLVYVDDTLIMGPSQAEIQDMVDLLAENFDIEDQGDVSDYLGVQVKHREDGSIEMTQQHLIQQVLHDLGMQENSKEFATPARLDQVLHADVNGKPFDENWHYRSVIGKLNFLEKSTRPDISYAVHQCARFCENPRKSHGEAIKRIARYLKATLGQGMIFRPIKHSFDCWVDASFSGEWHKPTAGDSVVTAKSRTGYVLMYAGCPLTWSSKLQTEIALSSTEAEYIAMSQALREVIPLMHILHEAVEHGVLQGMQRPRIHCKVFEDNSGALELAKVPKMRPRTKHINIKYHHFREYVRLGLVSVHPVMSADQIADIFTKSLPTELHQKLRRLIVGW